MPAAPPNSPSSSTSTTTARRRSCSPSSTAPTFPWHGSNYRTASGSSMSSASRPTATASAWAIYNDGKAQELLPEFDRPNVPLAWFELQNGKWIKHVVSKQTYGHGIGVGDINGDGRNDILTPQGWLEAPADVRAPGEWKFHPTDWDQHPIAPGGAVPPAGSRAKFGFMYAIDINQDGRTDVLTTCAHDYGLMWFEQTADGRWLPHVIDSTWSQALS